MTVRKCCKCWDQRPEKEMTKVPKKPEIRAVWIDKLGEKFARRIEGKTSMFVCRRHFEDLKAGTRRSPVLAPQPKIDEMSYSVGIPFNSITEPGKTSRVEPMELDENIIEERIELAEEIIVETDSREVEDIVRGEMDFGEKKVIHDCEDADFVLPSDCEEELAESRKPVYDYVMVDFDILIQCLLFCQKCSSRNVGLERQNTIGASFTAEMICNNCGSSWKWCSSRVNDYGRKVNSDISVASTLCGLSYSKLQQFFHCMRTPHLTERAHYNIIKKRVAPAIDHAYNKMQQNVLKVVVANAEKTGKINVAGDAMYDSPGFSAMVCRYAILDVETGFVVEAEAMRKERNESSKAQEPKSLEVALRRLERNVKKSGKSVVIDSITTDRDMTVKKMLAEKFPKIKTWYDIWHFVKNLQKSLWTKKERVYMLPVKHWMKPLCNHLYYSIASSSGDGELAKQKFMSFFSHIQGIHRGFKSIGNITFSKFKKCNHGKLKKVPGKYLDLRNEADKFAFDSLFELTATQKRLEDMTMVSPHWATSEVEAFNSVSLLYHPKSRFFSFYGFRMRMQLSVLHWNSLKLEKLDGGRQVIGKKSHYSKTHKKLVWKDVFTKGTMNWRNEIYDSLQRGDRDDQLSSVLDDANEAFDLELEEIAFDDFAFEFEAEDIDTELESDDDNETEDVENDEGGLRDDGDLKIDMNEKKSLMKDWSTLVVGIEDRILQFPLKKKKDVSELCGLNFSSGFTSHPDLVKMLKSTKYDASFIGEPVSSGDEDD